MELEQEVSRGNLAKAVLDNPIYQEAFSQLREQILQEWVDSPIRDQEGREKLWTSLKLLEKTKANLEQVMETGKLARLQIQDQTALAKARQFAKNWIG